MFFHYKRDRTRWVTRPFCVCLPIQNRTCQTFVYKVTSKWDLAPNQVTQLVPTAGHELTMITCDPWWQDYNRLVWRAELITAPAPSSPGSTGGSVANPAF